MAAKGIQFLLHEKLLTEIHTSGVSQKILLICLLANVYLQDEWLMLIKLMNSLYYFY